MREDEPRPVVSSPMSKFMTRGIKSLTINNYVALPLGSVCEPLTPSFDKNGNPLVMDAVAGGACEVEWTWLSANDQVGEAMLVARGVPLRIHSLVLIRLLKTFLRVSKTVTRP
jgi:hypothetical protein